MEDDELETERPDDELLRNSVKKNNNRVSDGDKTSGGLDNKMHNMNNSNSSNANNHNSDFASKNKEADNYVKDKLEKNSVNSSSKQVNKPGSKRKNEDNLFNKKIETNEKKDIDNNDLEKNEDNKKSIDNNSDFSENIGENTKIGSLIDGHNKILFSFIGLIPFFLLIVIFCVIIYALSGPVSTAYEMLYNFFDKMYDVVLDVETFFNKAKNFISDSYNYLFEKEEDIDNELLYYSKLYVVKGNYKDKYNICIDTNLITATLTIEDHFDPFIKEGMETEEGDKTSVEESNGKYNYAKMIKEADLLARMQVKHVYYGWDTSLDRDSILSGKYCKSSGTTSYVPVTDENKSNFSLNDGGKVYLARNSENAEAVSKNDDGGLLTSLFSKEIYEENREYILYQPVANSEGSCSDAVLPEIKYESSIGTYATREDSVYYWNLIYEFIPDYYSDLLTGIDDENQRQERIIEIADAIYSYYDTFEKTCDVRQTYASSTYSSICPDGVVVVTKDKNTKEVISQEVIPLEDYVAGVVQAENLWEVDGNIENSKAQAVAARTYVLRRTNYCQNAIDNSSGAQNYKSNVSETAKKAADETRGIVLTDSSDNLISTEYDAFCVTNNSGDYYTIQQQNQQIPKSFADSFSGSYSTKTWDNWTHCYCNMNDKVPREAIDDYCFRSDGTYNDGGHGRGMSQFGSRYLQTQGYDYKQILQYYYGSDIVFKEYQNYGDWATWSQKDERWASTTLGSGYCSINASGKEDCVSRGGNWYQATLGSVGCYVTSIAITIAKSGVPANIDDFNPGTFAQYLDRRGAFTSGGSFNNGSALQGIVNHISITSTSDVSPNNIANLMNNGKYVIVFMKYRKKTDTTYDSGTHFMAVDRVEGNTVYLHDPARVCTTLDQCRAKFTNARYADLRVLDISS